jgi:hypothetical protein
VGVGCDKFVVFKYQSLIDSALQYTTLKTICQILNDELVENNLEAKPPTTGGLVSKLFPPSYDGMTIKK